MPTLDPTPPGPYRIDVSDGLRRASWTLDAPWTDIGRADDNDIVLYGARVSRHHLRVERDDAGLFVTPRSEATLPTMLQGRAIDRRTAIADQAVIRFGSMELTIVDEAVGPARSEPAAPMDPATVRQDEIEPDAPDAADAVDDLPSVDHTSAGAAAPSGRGSVIINPMTQSTPDDAAAAQMVAPPSRLDPGRWLRRHWPLVVSLVVMVGVVVAVSSADRRAPPAKSVVLLCDAHLATPHGVSCPGPEACIRAAEGALAAAKRHAGNRLGVVGAPDVIAEAQRAIALSWPLVFRRPGIEAAARGIVLSKRPVDEGVTGLMSAAGGLVADQAGDLRATCRKMQLEYRRARQATHDRRAAVDVARQMMQLFPNPRDPRHIWARRELGRLE